ncbi:hypothetical protein [Jannaschia sp. R86511]|uniref:hypothetical protein n=1 Tax=Jannaschia sp. R86511 TaxID=3093853 RepID=UPI0036D28DD2
MPASGRAAAGSLRAVVASAAVVGLAGAGHLLAGGGTPSLRALVLALLVVALLSTSLATRRVTAWRAAAVVGGGQVVLHHAFGWSPGDHKTGGGHDALFSDPGMLAAHAFATVVTVVALRRGEAALVALGSWVGPLRLVLAAILPLGPVRPLLAAGEPAPLGGPAAATDPVRGPPHLLVLAA